jgi:hypothetical protein
VRPGSGADGTILGDGVGDLVVDGLAAVTEDLNRPWSVTLT